MTENPIADHPLRFALSNELHARPFPELTAPCRAAYLVIKQPSGAAKRDRLLDRAHLLALLDRYGAAHPSPDATHHTASLGRSFLKWEMHSEFVSYSLYTEGVEERPFDGHAFNLFPKDWLAEAPGVVISSVLMRMETTDFATQSMPALSEKLGKWFVSESLVAAYVVDREAIIATDFRIDEAGHVRFAVVVNTGVSQRRLGRIAQRLLETETYMNASMLGFPLARRVADEVDDMQAELSAVFDDLAEDKSKDSATLEELLHLAGRIENLASRTAFRFGATEAYSKIVEERIKILREERFEGRQMMSEFMMRRYMPAMRTCLATKNRLHELSERTERAANLLRTRVDVENAAQNKLVLARMDQRAGLQLRLQETVEGLSVVAISYYAVSLLNYLLAPVAPVLGLEKYQLSAMITVPVLLLVWVFAKRVRARLK